MLFNNLSKTRACIRSLLLCCLISVNIVQTKLSFAGTSTDRSVKQKMTPLILSVDKNPGNLAANLILNGDKRPLLVLLHGCTQTGETFADNSGLLQAAENYQLNLLIIEQSSQNNPQLCFNWFSNNDTQKGSGEHKSIVNFTLLAEKSVNTSENYLIGLSAGGAMANAVFTQNPELYRGLAVVAGLPYPCASTLTEAISCMKSGPAHSVKQLSASILQGAELFAEGKKRHIIIVSGTADEIVNPINSKRTAQQYTKASQAVVIGPEKPSLGPAIHHWTRIDQSGSVAIKVQHLEYKSLGHGWPIKQEHSDVLQPYFLPSSLPLTDFIIKSWFGLGG